MKPKILLRTASILMLLHAIGHTMGTLSWKQTTDPKEAEVIKQMTDNKFPFMGAVHSLADAFDGFGFGITLALLFIAGILWISSKVTAPNVLYIKKILVLVSIVLFLWGIDELIYFFPMAAAFSLISMTLTVIAVYRLEKVPQ